MIAEFQATDSAMDGGFYDKELDYVSWLKGNQGAEMGLNLPEGYVPAIQYVSFDEKGRALGFLHLRLRLNDYLREKGGHIGYSIRPSERQKGYAKEQLKLGLREAHAKNISPVLVTCHETNEASRRTILACGGHLENVSGDTERYWIGDQDAKS